MNAGGVDMVRAEWFCTPSVDANDMEKFTVKRNVRR